MKNLFKKLHNIVTDQADDNSHNNSSSSSSPPSASPSREHKQQQSPLLGLPGWLNSMAGGRVGSGTNLSSLSASSPPHAPAAASSSPPPPPSSSVSSSSSAFSHLSSTTTTDVGAEVGGRRPTSLLDDEEYQIQVALELSAREDPEAFQIEAVKQISLGSVSPSQTTPAEVVAYRYWNYNVLSYGDKIFDGFYDLYGILSDHEAMKMPSLVDLQYTFPSGNIFWEAVLVNRTEDPELSKLEQKATMMAMESRSCIFSLPSSALVEKIASLVSNFMGGPAFNNEQMLQAWRSHSSSLRAKLGSNILPIGLLTVGLARHRALLFKVLADSVGIPCQLVKGKFHTGADDGAMNIVKLVDGREYIVDLMAEPGSLIPSDATDSQIEYGENTFASSHSVDEVNINMVSCSSGDSSLVNYLSSGGTPDTRSSVDRLAILEHSGINASAMRCSTNLTSKEVESSAGLHTDTVEIHNNSRTPLHNEEKANHESSSRSNSPHSIVRSPSWADGINSPSVNMMKVKDVSQYMIDATKENPQLVQKLHDVLRESGVVVPPNLFFEISKEKQDNATSSDCNSTDIEYGKGMSGFGEPDCKSSVGLGSPGMSPNKAMQKVILPRSDVDHVKPAVGLGTKNPLGMGDIAGIPYSSQCAESPQSQALQTKLIDNVPVAAAVATAAIVASSMVVAAGNRNSESNAEAAAAVTAAAALVATTAAVTVQQEQLLHGAPIPDYSFAPVGKKHDSPTFMEQKYRDAGHDYDLEPSMKTVVDNLEAKGNSDKSIGSGSTKSDDSFDDVAEVEISWEEIILGGRIGLGSYGEVYRGDWHGTEVAVKKFLNQDISGVALEEFRTEVRIMKKLRHPNVVLFMGAVTRAPNLAIVTEFLHRGSLFRLIHRPNNQLDERRRMRMALDVARGMNYLHNCSPVIVHRDLKSPNLLVDKNWVVKVCDFGLSRMKHSTFLSSRSTAGTAEWMAPEILRNEPSDEKCDVYSFGVILWELCTMQQPWGGMNAMQVVGAVGFQHRRLDIPADIEPGVASIIQRCWETDSAKRPSFSEIMTELKPLQKLISGNQSVRQKNSSGCQADTL